MITPFHMTQQADPVVQEILDWRAELANPKDIEITLQEILKAMSNGFDVSPLFADMLKLMTIKTEKLKKLVYIYLTSNARNNQQYTLLLVNALVFDTASESPLIRALALRTMAAVAIPEVAETFAEQFVKFSTDQDPFVRKTVCAGVAKLYKVARQTCYDLDLISTVHKMLFDGNQAVVAAAVGALIQIAELPDSGEKLPIFCSAESDQLLTALAQSSEWSACTILQGLSQYAQIQDTQLAAVRIQPFLQHGNPAVVLNAVNLLIKIGAAAAVSQSLLSLVSQAQGSEIQFVALRALRLAGELIDKNEFRRNIKVFYVRFNDDIYIKLEKIEILSGLVSQETVVDVLSELKEYCQDVNDQIVRASLRAISKIALLLPVAADMCVQLYLLLLTGTSPQQEPDEKQTVRTQFKLPPYAAQELLVCIQNIFRYYPNRYEGVIGDLCEAIYEYDDFRAKSALIWILGEYAERIDGVEDVFRELLGLESSAEALANEHAAVQLATITAAAKIFLAQQKDTTQQLFHSIIDFLQESDEPGVRQRARYIQRLFKLDPTLAFAKSVIYVQKSIPVYNDGVAPILKAQLQCKLGSVPATLRELVAPRRVVESNAEEIIEQFENQEYVEEVQQAIPQVSPEDMQQLQQTAAQNGAQQPHAAQHAAPQPGQPGQPPVAYAAAVQPHQQSQTQSIIDDLLGFDFASAKPAQAQPAQQQIAATRPSAPAFQQPAPPVFTASVQAPAFQQTSGAPDMLGLPQMQQPAQQPLVNSPAPQFQHPETPADAYTFHGLPCRAKESTYNIQISLGAVRVNGVLQLLLSIKNISNQPVMKPHLQFMPNAFGIQATDLGIPIIPALNNYNGGNAVPIPLIAEAPGGPLIGKAGQFDPKMQSNLNVLTFSISQQNGPEYFFQMKMPIAVLFSENSLWHQNRALANPGGAQLALNQSNGWPEFSESTVVQGDTAQNIIAGACQSLQRANFLTINISAELADFVSCFQVLGVNTVAFTRLFWSIQGNCVQFKALVRVQQPSSICGAFVANSVAQILGKK